MPFRDVFIEVGNSEKGYALFNKTTGEFLTDFEYDNVVPTTYGLHFLYKGENGCKIVDDNGKKVNLNKDYFWGTLGREPFGVGNVVHLTTDDCYLANHKGQILSKGYNRRLVPISSTARIYEATNVDKNSGSKQKGLLNILGEEIVPCIDEYIPLYEDVFVLTELIEKQGYGLIKYASDDILASDMIFIKLVEAGIKSLYTLPDFIDKKEYISLFCAEAVAKMDEMRTWACLNRSIKRNKSDQKLEEVFDRFDKLVDKLVEDEIITNRIMSNFLKKTVQNLLEKLLDSSNFILIT